MLRCQKSSPPADRGASTAPAQPTQLQSHAGAFFLEIQNKQDDDVCPQQQLVLLEPRVRGTVPAHPSLVSHCCVKIKALISSAASSNVSSHSCMIIEMRMAASRETAMLTACRSENPSCLQVKEIPLAGRERKVEGERLAGHFPCQTS